MISVERLRIWLLAAAGLLTVVLVAFLAYAHLRAHRFLAKLPGRLGVDLRQETSGFTWSQSVKGKTVFTIHASKAVQHLDGKVTLRDVGIIVYGQTQDRADRISGSEFEYDQAAGIVRAKGEVNLDLQTPAGAGAKPSDDRIIHAKTSGLVFLQKERVASTDNEVDFHFRGLTGHAKGANYSSDAGTIALHADVRMSGTEGNTPFTLTSSQASFDRSSERILLRNARYTGRQASAQRKAKADRAVVFFRDDGTAEKIEAEGDVTLLDGSRSIAGGRSRVSLANGNHLRLVEMWNGVRLTDNTPGQQTNGRAEQGTAHFNGTGHIEQILLHGKVDLHERQSPIDTSAGFSDRTLSASMAEINFAPGASSLPVMRAVNASGDARVILVQSGGASALDLRNELAGDRLHANLRSEGGKVELSSIDGSGHTLLRRVDSKGSVETSTGETLQVDFASSKPQRLIPLTHSRSERKAGAGSGARSSGILQAVQRGGVTMTRVVAQPKGPPQSQQATAGKATYDGPADGLTLTDGVHLFDKESDLRADSVRSSRGGETTAEGAVRASYRREDESEPVHVLGARAVMQNNAGVVTFYGADHKPARLWQAGSQVEAPVLTFNQKEGLLIASSEGSRSAAVRTVLAGRGALPGDKAGSPEASVSRVQSSELRYSQADGIAKFLGGVRLDTGVAQLRGDEATVFLQRSPGTGKSLPVGDRQAAPPPQGSRDEFLSGALNHFVAKGHVVLDESGRRAIGDQIVYTAADETFLLTGTAQIPPRITDESGTAVTGTSLRFRRGDNSVVVSGRDANGSQVRRVRTETRIKQE